MGEMRRVPRIGDIPVENLRLQQHVSDCDGMQRIYRIGPREGRRVLHSASLSLRNRRSMMLRRGRPEPEPRRARSDLDSRGWWH